MCQLLSFICPRPSSAAYACCHLKCSFGSRNFCWLVSYDVIISALHFDSRYSSPTRTHINTSPRQRVSVWVYLCATRASRGHAVLDVLSLHVFCFASRHVLPFSKFHGLTTLKRLHKVQSQQVSKHIFKTLLAWKNSCSDGTLHRLIFISNMICFQSFNYVAIIPNVAVVNLLSLKIELQILMLIIE